MFPRNEPFKCELVLCKIGYAITLKTYNNQNDGQTLAELLKEPLRDRILSRHVADHANLSLCQLVFTGLCMMTKEGFFLPIDI